MGADHSQVEKSLINTEFQHMLAIPVAEDQTTIMGSVSKYYNSPKS